METGSPLWRGGVGCVLVSRAGMLEDGWTHASGASESLPAGHGTSGNLCVVPSILPFLLLGV